VEDCDDEECHEGEKEPPWREGVTMKREPGCDYCCDDKEKADIAEAAMQSFEVRNLHLAGLLALAVLLGWRDCGGMHKAIIA
jgi:hypothetical protein